jgi:hypothetical protein
MGSVSAGSIITQVAVRMRPLTANEKMQGHRPCCRVVGDQVPSAAYMRIMLVLWLMTWRACVGGRD